MKLINNTRLKKNIKNVLVGKDVKIFDFVNLYGCSIGDNTTIATFVEVQKGATIGKRCRIQSHTFICDGVAIEDDVFIGHGVVFINDNKPTIEKTINKTWKLQKTLVKKTVTIGSAAVIMGGVTIGENAFIGAGSVVTKNVKANTIVVGIPARVMCLGILYRIVSFCKKFIRKQR